ncbi:MAG: glycosyltransferase domain-containing protein [Pseudomonadota bacterium]
MVFLASKKKRRELEIAKFGGLRQPAAIAAGTVTLSQAKSKSPYVDLDWYSAAHELAGPVDAVRHYSKHGMSKALAPCAAMAGADGIRLAPWAAEYFVRIGVPLGAPGEKKLSPDDQSALRAFSIRNTARKRIAVVTANFGGFDRLLPVEGSWSHEADFFVFSDRRFEEQWLWQLVQPNYHNADPRRSARFVKLHLPTYFADYEWVIWVDGSVLFCASPAEVLAAIDAENLDFATFRHPDRQGVVSEAAACIRFKKEEPMVLVEHLSRLQHHKAFRAPALYETMVMALRPGAPAVRELSTNWWRMMMQGSKRDQLSLPLAIAETPGLRVGHLPDDMPRSTLFARSTHIQRN